MRKTLPVLGLISAIVLAPIGAAADGGRSAGPAGEAQATSAPGTGAKGIFLTSPVGEFVLAKSAYIGKNVYAEDGAVIGDIEDVVLEGDRVVAILVGVGGFLGVGERKIGVRYGALRFVVKDAALKIVLPGATKEQLAAVEPFALTAPPKKNILQKAGEVAKDAARKAGDVAKAGLDKAKEAVQGAPSGEETTTTEIK